MTATADITAQPDDLEHIEGLADELLRALTPHAGDPDAVRRVLLAWTDTLDPTDLGLVCIRAVWRTFADCLTVVPVDQAPPGALALIPPQEESTDDR